MPIEQLKPLVDIALRMAKASLEARGTVSPFFVLHFPDGSTQEFLVPDEADCLMNSFTAKEVLFAFVRQMAEAKKADAVIFAAEMWAATPTEAAKGIPPDEYERLLREKGFQTALDLGLVERHEIVSVLAQDAAEMMQTSQRFRRVGVQKRIEYYGEQLVFTVPQENYSGSTKMFGAAPDIRPEAERLLHDALTNWRNRHADPS